MPNDGRPPAARREEPDLRERILAASIELIEKDGPAHLSMREVARRAGVTHQAPYHHFADREAILAEIATEGFRKLAEAIERATRGGQKQSRKVSPADRVSAMAGAYVEFACGNPAYFRLMFRPDMVNLERYPAALQAGERAFAIVSRVVHESVEEGLPAYSSEEGIVDTVWSLAHGLASLLLEGPLATVPKNRRSQRKARVTNVLAAWLASSMPSRPKSKSRR